MPIRLSAAVVLAFCLALTLAGAAVSPVSAAETDQQAAPPAASAPEAAPAEASPSPAQPPAGLFVLPRRQPVMPPEAVDPRGCSFRENQLDLIV